MPSIVGSPYCFELFGKFAFTFAAKYVLDNPNIPALI
jgi:hypothetical protein